ncbi:MAG: hypothetical protein NC203_01065 [Firmicutes bacterium]|nr:hypothetical protein [[Eubacterium] siraeum]MCM1486930.1 hypothetical protein [Bacillota bacterium]
MYKFKGYYFKCSSPQHTLALIPACHGIASSLQIITENSSYNVDLDFLRFGEKPSRVKTNNCIFSEKGLLLEIDTDEVKAKGLLHFGKLTSLSYDIMGPFKLLAPILQCRHRVISMYNSVNEKISVNKESFLFRNGKGYIEGDEGVSFPSSYIWAQCFWNVGSMMLSAADVPLPGFSINGIIGAIITEKKEYRFGTYLGASAKYLSRSSAVIKQGDYTLTVKNLSEKGHDLFAPNNGCMNRIICENVKSRIYVNLKRKNNTLLEFVSDEGSFESEIQ